MLVLWLVIFNRIFVGFCLIVGFNVYIVIMYLCLFIFIVLFSNVLLFYFILVGLVWVFVFSFNCYILCNCWFVMFFFVFRECDSNFVVMVFFFVFRF